MNRINIWIALLLASVLLNGVLLGAGARSWFGPQPSVTAPGPEVRPGRGFNMRGFVAALPQEHRGEARRLARSERRALREDLRAAGWARRRAYEVLNADPFDADAAGQALAEAREARAVIERRTEAIILEVAADLTPDERSAALSAALGPPRFNRRRGPPRGE